MFATASRGIGCSCGRSIIFNNILVPTDGSEFSDKAIEEAARLAKELGSKLTLFYAAPHYRLPGLSERLSTPDRLDARQMAITETEAEAQTVLASAASNVNLEGVAVERDFTVSDSPYEAIIEAAKRFQCELIVMASHGRRGLSAIVLGSEAQKVLVHSKIPVLVVR